MRINTSILIAAVATLKKAQGDFIPKSRVLERGKPPKTLENGKIVAPQSPIKFDCEEETWITVVNNNNAIQDSAGGFGNTMFASYNAASVNRDGVVVFRARSTGGGNPSTGVFVKDVLTTNTEIVRQAGRGTDVPQPNNLNTAFIEFPSFPRMSIKKDCIATRGLHSPVLEYGEEGAETRLGNTGLYFNLKANTDEVADGTSEKLETGVAKLGSVEDFILGSIDDFTIFKVPGLPEGDSPIVFDVFPGSPAIDDYGNIAFKGNYPKYTNDGEVLGQTGVYYRSVKGEEAGGKADIYVVANSETLIPGDPEGCQTDTFEGTTFGSTSPPSIAKNKMVFRGPDNEDDPSCGCGGIYEAGMDSGNFPLLTTLVDLETPVPGEDPTAKFTRFGEALSYDGDAVAFWAGWGEDMETVSLCCPESGEKLRRKWCVDNDTDTVCDSYAPEGCECYQNKTVPVNQGIFVNNGVTTTAVAKGRTTGGQDFISWNYSGKPPGLDMGPPTTSSPPTSAGGGRHSYLRRRITTTADDDDDESEAAEEPRWRSSASLALSEPNNIVYKMISDDVAGIYHWNGGDVDSGVAIVKAGNDCTTLDDNIPPTALPLVVAELAIERDSFRNSTDGSSILVLAASCGDEHRRLVADEDEDDGDIEDWGGIYLTKLCNAV
ncbi:hypothetical protein ACHAXR_009256 [Thalassiosira sp. AJA248-18]